MPTKKKPLRVPAPTPAPATGSVANALYTIGVQGNFLPATSPQQVKKRSIGPSRHFCATGGLNINGHPSEVFAMKTRKFLWYLAMLQLGIFAAARAEEPVENETDNVNWQEAARFVDTLYYKPNVIDSIKSAFQVSFPSSPLRSVPEQSFSRGEILVYDVGWGPFKAGYVVLTAEPDPANGTIREYAKY